MARWPMTSYWSRWNASCAAIFSASEADRPATNHAGPSQTCREVACPTWPPDQSARAFSVEVGTLVA